MGAETVASVRAALDRLLPEVASGAFPAMPIGIAVSGGGDSVALLVIAARWAGDRGCRLAAATVDHRLRPESGAEAAAVTALAAGLGIPHDVLVARGLGSASGNLAAAARDARYELLGGWARGQGIGAVLIGHTMDDQAETVLMRLARGSGAEGLSAMQERSRRDGVTWLRPLLGIRRDDLRAVLRDAGVGWIEDPTNEDADYDRVKARKALAALAPLGVDVEGLARTAWRLQRQRRVLERAKAQLAARARRWGRLGEAMLDPGAMAEDEPDTALRLLADTTMRVSGSIYRPRFRALEGAFARMLKGEALTLAGCLICPQPQAGTLICREPAACEAAIAATSEVTVWDRRWEVTVANFPPDARLGALGEAGLAELRRQAEDGVWTPSADWQAAPREVRLTTPALWSGAGAKPTALLSAPLADYPGQRGLGAENSVAVRNTAAAEPD